jgi:hypothetical protein
MGDVFSETSGPPSGTSTTVVYIYEFLEPAKRAEAATASSSIFQKLLQMEGILKDVYKELDGAEKAIREEREGYCR